MFDLATYPAISLSLSKFNLTITTNITNQGKKYIGQKKKKENELLSVFLRTPRIHQLVSQRIIKERNDSILIHYSRSLELSLERN